MIPTVPNNTLLFGKVAELIELARRQGQPLSCEDVLPDLEFDLTELPD